MIQASITDSMLSEMADHLRKVVAALGKDGVDERSSFTIARSILGERYTTQMHEKVVAELLGRGDVVIRDKRMRAT